MFKSLIVLLLFLTFASAGVAEELNGKLLWEQRCSPCHSLEPPPKAAPPVRGIVMHYRPKHSDRESFAVAVSDFVHNTVTAEALLPQAKQRFGMMPPLPFDKEELKSIARWMWDVTLKTPLRGSPRLICQEQHPGDPLCDTLEP